MDSLIRVVVVLAMKLFAPMITHMQFRVSEAGRRMRANGWQPTQGTVQQVHIVETETSHNAELAYSYSWHGEYFSGFSKREFGRERDVDQFASIFRSGTSIMVRVNADRPERSALLYDEQFVKV